MSGFHPFSSDPYMGSAAPSVDNDGGLIPGPGVGTMANLGVGQSVDIDLDVEFDSDDVAAYDVLGPVPVDPATSSLSGTGFPPNTMGSDTIEAHQRQQFPAPLAEEPPRVQPPPVSSAEQPFEGTLHTRSTFYVPADLGATAGDASYPQVAGQMYVESLQPTVIMHPHPIILVHGDWHTGQVWNSKPDGLPGWASFFVYNGYHVFIVDLVPCGRSTITCDGKPLIAARSNVLDRVVVERDITAPAKQPIEAWSTARLHNKWPGEGVRGDAVFENYYASRVPLPLGKAERQTLAQSAVGRLLSMTGRAVLVGEGSGATVAWLAADVQPSMVAAVVAIEPAGPPAGVASQLGSDGVRRFAPYMHFVPGMRPYGLADVPLTYDPPALARSDGGPVLDLGPRTYVTDDGARRTCILQRGRSHLLSGYEEGGFGQRHDAVAPRRLVHLAQMPHLMLTAQASPHSAYDWATADFLRQAGADVLHLRLDEINIRGNGHLLFLETNSNEIAALVCNWIYMKERDRGV